MTQSLFDDYYTSDVEIVTVGFEEKEDEIGIHLYEPSQLEIDRAMERADAMGFETIYVHTHNP